MSNIFFYEPFYDLDRVVDEALSSGNRHRISGKEGQLQRSSDSGEGAIRPFKPRMDLHEDKDKNIVTASFELPGLKKEDVQIDVHNGRLTISAESKLSSEHDESGYAVRERRYGKLSRTLQLPQGLSEDTIKANLNDGILTVTFPRSSPEMAHKKITVS